MRTDVSFWESLVFDGIDGLDVEQRTVRVARSPSRSPG
ncbi:hypothetical protein ABH925_007531 [Streptacidiphilus sp. EB129]